MVITCDCGRQLVEGTTRLESNLDGPSAWRTTFSCPACKATFTRWTERPLVNVDGRVGGERRIVHWSPREPGSKEGGS
jgi:hypothetical protein